MDVRLGAHPGCIHDHGCGPFTERVHRQLSGGRYDWPAAILPLSDIDEYVAAHRTARKRAARARRLGYHVTVIERADHSDAIYRINTSAPERQGRPMAAGYLQPAQLAPLPVYPCPRHRISQFGVFHGDELAGYLVLYVCGDLGMVSQILGHARRLRDDVMYLLVQEALRTLPLPAAVFYNRWDSGTDGLRFFKERLGFKPARVRWLP